MQEEEQYAVLHEFVGHEPVVISESRARLEGGQSAGVEESS